MTRPPRFSRWCLLFVLVGTAAADTSPGDLVGMTAVLTDAVYFQGKWQTLFLKPATKPGPFTLETGATKTLPMMAQTATLPYLDRPDFQAAALPYGNGRLSLYVFLNAGTWEGWVGAMNGTQAALTLPRFKVDYTVALNPSPTALGMGSAFAPAADFTPMGLRGSFAWTTRSSAPSGTTSLGRCCLPA